MAVVDYGADQPTPKSGEKIYKWGILPTSRTNTTLKSLTPNFVFIGIAIVFNNSPIGRKFYLWLNANYTPFEINFYWTVLITQFVYWFTGFIYMAVDLTGYPKCIAQYKLQPTKRPTWADYKKILPIIFRNTCFAIFLTYLNATIRPLRTTLPLPGPLTIVCQYLIALAGEEIGFYHVHSTLHNPKYYKQYHKKHHEFTAPCAFSSTYCSLTEHASSNILPVVFALYLMNVHISILWLFFCSLEFNTLAVHSGYNLIYNNKALAHDWHHFAFTENFGPTGFFDWLYGTDKIFREWMGRLEREWGPGTEKKARELIATWEEEKVARKNEKNRAKTQ